MITFTICLLTLIIVSIFYGRYVEKVFAPDLSGKTPAVMQADGVDFLPLPAWKIFMIQFLNIAGLGPIFGAIMGAKFGAACYLWIVLGCLLGGAVHDYFSGMISLRNNGRSLPELIAKYLGVSAGAFVRVLIFLTMLLVCAVFVIGPAGLLTHLTEGSVSTYVWVAIIFAYYAVATILPIDKIIGKIYPLFAFVLIIMAVGILVMLYVHNPAIPEFWDGLQNTHPQHQSLPIFPILFVSVACGAVSGFHATQSPMMARCMTNEKQGRPIFFGAMITEGIVALIWAAAATAFYHENGMAESNASVIVESITHSWLGPVGGMLALLGVVAAPISTGDTALRSGRLIIADIFKMEQRSIKSRLLICIPIFVITIGIVLYILRDEAGFDVVWRYFAWINQSISVFTLWTITVYLSIKHKNYLITLIPAIFMTVVCVSYIFIAPEGFAVNRNLAYLIGILSAVLLLALFIYYRVKIVKRLDERKRMRARTKL